MKTIIITNIPSPYRVLQFNLLNERLKTDLLVIYYRKNESNRKWTVPELSNNHLFLKPSYFSKFNIFPDIFSVLFKNAPDIIIAAGFTPTILIAFLYAKLKKKKFIVFTDSWYHSVNQLSFIHKFLRRTIIPKADASICIGKKGKQFLTDYGAKANSVFISPLAIDNSYYNKFIKNMEKREYDLLFSGQFIDRKMPFFIIGVLKELNKSFNKLKFLLIGSGPKEKDILMALDSLNINYTFPGFIQQSELPSYYANAKILLFPTRNDPWGLVANEACAAGTPVITNELSGVADDLIIHNYNGFILPLNINTWCDHIKSLLDDKKRLNSFSQNALNKVEEYSLNNSVEGMLSAINFCSPS